MRLFLMLLLYVSSISQITFAMEISKHANDYKKLNAIQLTGLIENGDTFRLKSYISELENRKNIAVYLDSDGGALIEGMKLGRFFRERQIKTVIEENKLCASACALAFLGGFNKNTGLAWRTKTSNSGLGFHTFYNDFTGGEVFSAEETSILVRMSQLIILEIITYFEEMRVSTKLLKKTLSTDNDEMYWVSNSEALDFGFHVWDTKTEKLINADKFLSVLK